MKKTTRWLSILLCMLMLISPMCLSVSAASYDDDYYNHNEPEKNDYASYGKSTATKAEIKWIQAALNFCIKNRGLNATKLTVDGSFGPASKKATEAFQNAAGLSVDGSFGPTTFKKMKDVLEKGNETTLASKKNYTVTLKTGLFSNLKLESINGSSVKLPYISDLGVQIKYSANGGTGAPYSRATIVKGLGWSNSPNSTRLEYRCGIRFTPTSNMTLYPVYQYVKISTTIPKNGNKVFVGWSTDKNATTAMYKAGESVRLDGRVTLYAVWKNFEKKNILQWDYTKTLYNGSNIKNSGCGIVSAVSAVYNATGNFIEPTTVAAWAYKERYYNNPNLYSNGGGIPSTVRDAYIKAFANKYGAQYGFKLVDTGKKIDNKLKNHLANGGTAIVHVKGHYMCLAGYDEDKKAFLVFDPSPGIDRAERLVACNRKGLTSAEGSWIHESKLTKGNINNNPIHVDWYYLIAAK